MLLKLHSKSIERQIEAHTIKPGHTHAHTNVVAIDISMCVRINVIFQPNSQCEERREKTISHE